MLRCPPQGQAMHFGGIIERVIGTMMQLVHSNRGGCEPTRARTYLCIVVPSLYGEA